MLSEVSGCYLKTVTAGCWLTAIFSDMIDCDLMQMIGYDVYDDERNDFMERFVALVIAKDAHNNAVLHKETASKQREAHRQKHQKPSVSVSPSVPDDSTNSKGTTEQTANPDHFKAVLPKKATNNKYFSASTEVVLYVRIVGYMCRTNRRSRCK